MRIVEAGYADDVVQRLVAQVQAEYVTRYGGPDGTPVDPDEFTPAAGGTFLVGLVDEEPVACGGLRRHDPTSAEVKRMFVAAGHRGRGHAREVLAALEDAARGLGYARVILETGMAQPEAIALYESSGYHRIPGFGYYRNSPLNRCYAREL